MPSTVTLQLNGILIRSPELMMALGKDGEICAVDPVLTSSQFIARDAEAEPVFSITATIFAELPTEIFSVGFPLSSTAPKETHPILGVPLSTTT